MPDSHTFSFGGGGETPERVPNEKLPVFMLEIEVQRT